ncbi:hypothetical protein L2E82_30767 [Cichorium intybus]|uniref:Uncharacterized protein n=1 Tax=Cichorium intybus TaxID=13427 RepID=A0ACB9D1A2_CICIN|nr:hypothetical protein L2E82_30767 [Cichorium intybus]
MLESTSGFFERPLTTQIFFLLTGETTGSAIEVAFPSSASKSIDGRECQDLYFRIGVRNGSDIGGNNDGSGMVGRKGRYG